MDKQVPIENSDGSITYITVKEPLTKQDRLKFRYVWSDGKNFIIEDFTLDEISNGMIYDSFENEPFRRDYRLIDRLQCTGLKDKNGTLIYANDIVKTLVDHGAEGIDSTEIINLVVSYNGCSYYPFDDLGVPEWQEYEVIGNIHQNKDLLGE